MTEPDGWKVVSVGKVPELARRSIVRPDGSEVLFRLFEAGHWTLVLKGDGVTTLQASGVLDRMCYSQLPETMRQAERLT